MTLAWGKGMGYGVLIWADDHEAIVWYASPPQNFKTLEQSYPWVTCSQQLTADEAAGGTAGGEATFTCYKN